MTLTYLLNVIVMLALVAGMAVGTLWLLRKFPPGRGIDLLCILQRDGIAEHMKLRRRQEA